MEDYKYKFVRSTLLSEGKRLLKNQEKAISGSLRSRTGALLRERRFRLKGEGSDMELVFEHPAYLRFLDIRNRNNRKRKGQTKRSTNKDMRIYNRFVMGHYYVIANRLMHDYTEEVRDILVDKWEGVFDGR